VWSDRPPKPRAIQIRVISPWVETSSTGRFYQCNSPPAIRFADDRRRIAKKGAAEAAPLKIRKAGGYSVAPAGLNSWIAALLSLLSANDTFLAWSAPVWQPSQVTWVGMTRPFATAAAWSFITLILR